MGWRNLVCGHIILMLGVCAYGAPDPNEKGNYVSRQEYEALKKELDDVKGRLSAREKAPESQEQIQQEIGRLNKEVARARQIAEGSGLGDTRLLITGSAAAGYFDPEDESSTFTAEFNPMLLWQLNERLFFEGELELGLEGPELNGEGSETEAELDLAYLSYLINDYAAVSAGKFSVPFTAYHNHLDPSWINKLPIDPLVYADGGIAPDTGVGAFVTGAVSCRRGIFNYAVFLTNGPALITDDPESAGSLNFDNFNDLNNNKALGVRIGYLPIPQLEVGYSFEFSNRTPQVFEPSVRRFMAWTSTISRIGAVQGQVTARVPGFGRICATRPTIRRVCWDSGRCVSTTIATAGTPSSPIVRRTPGNGGCGTSSLPCVTIGSKYLRRRPAEARRGNGPPASTTG